MATNTNNLTSNFPVPPNPVPTALSEFWPLLCKGQADRLIFAGPPQLEAQWHKAMEEGRKLEGSINDAMFAVQKEKEDIQRAIVHYLDLNQVATDAQLNRTGRRFALAADILNFIQKIHTFMNDIQGLTQAIQTNLQILQIIETQAQSMVQNSLNSLANFMLQICNLGLPPLPSMPSFFGTNIFSFNGFDFATQIPRNVSFSAFSNFSFAQCTLAAPNTGIFVQPPVVVNFEGYTVGSTGGSFVPPLNGIIGNAALLSTSAYIKQMQGQTDIPVYNPMTLNPATLLEGSLPNPAFIISNYLMPSATYKTHALSTLPVLQSLITAQPSDAIAQERTLLVENVSLTSIIASHYDKNLTAAWLFYLESARAGRAGVWLPNFEAAYQTYIQPSLTMLNSPDTTIPWNTVLGGSGTVSAPTNIPLIDMLQKISPAAAQNILWKLSYVEASLLGYSRTSQFDAAADSFYLSAFTGADLDYATTVYSIADTVTIVLGADTAEFPVSCTLPKAILHVLNAVIALAEENIAEDATYVTSRPQFRFTYSALAQATQVDRFTQFWRTFNYNLQQLLAQDPYLIGFVVSYADSLDSAVDPLGAPADFLQIQNDTLTRNRAWVPGQPPLPLPVPPSVEIGPLPGITGTTNGWGNSGFDPQSFLDRPDIQSLPLPVQLTMLRTNESYAAVMRTATSIQTAIDTATAQGKAALASIQNNGFDVTSSGPLKVKNNAIPLPVVFDHTSYDNTNYVTSPTLFTIQVTGLYMVTGTVTWDKGPAGVRTLMLMQNSAIVLDEVQTNALSIGPITQNFSVVQQLNAGDTLQVLASQVTGEDSDTLPGAEFSVLLVPASEAKPQSASTDASSPKGDNQVRQLIADATMESGTAIQIQSDGGVLPVDPVGAIVTPFVDGVVTDAVQDAELANVGTNYGSLYTVTGAAFAVGGLLYAGPGGVLTQDYNTLITEVNWVIVVGRAIGPDMMLFEPQIPTKVVPF